MPTPQEIANQKIADQLNAFRATDGKSGPQFAVKDGMLVAPLTARQAQDVQARAPASQRAFNATLFGVGVPAKVDVKNNQLILDPKAMTPEKIESYGRSIDITSEFLSGSMVQAGNKAMGLYNKLQAERVEMPSREFVFSAAAGRLPVQNVSAGELPVCGTGIMDSINKRLAKCR